MSSSQVTIPPGGAYAAVSLAMPAGTMIVNQSTTTVVWLADGAGVSPGNGIPVQPQGSVTWASAGACYGVCDTGATAAVQLLVTDAVSGITDPVSLAVAVAQRLAGQQVNVANSPTVQLAAGTEVDLTAGTQVVLANGSTVALAAGTAVDLAHPVALATGAQVGLASGSQVAVNGGTLGAIQNAIPVQTHAVSSVGSITNTVTVQGTAKVQQMAQQTLLSTQTFTVPNAATNGYSANLSDVSGFSNYASVLITLNQPIMPSGGPFPGTIVALNLSWDGISSTQGAWWFGILTPGTDFIQIPSLGDRLSLSWSYFSSSGKASPGSFGFSTRIYGSNLNVPKIRYSQGGGQGFDPTQPWEVGSYGGTTGTFKDPIPSTSGRLFVNMRCNATTGAMRHYLLAENASNNSTGAGEFAIATMQYPVNTPVMQSYSVEVPGMLVPLASQISVVTAGGVVLSTISEVV